MKKLLIILLTACLLPLGFTVQADDIRDDGFLRGVWVSSVVNLDYPSRPGLSDAELRQEADRIISVCADTGMNAIFFQVRPCADALYNSSVFPASYYLTGGKSEYLSFDPLAYMIQQAHARGIQLHAWINPYRVTRVNGGAELNRCPQSSPQRRHPEYLMRASDGNYFFNPALQEVRDLITLGVEEILNNYDVDGIHFDDYFYPETGFNDSAQFAASGWANVAQWRINNVNLLVQQVSETVRAHGKVFGISPRGIWANAGDDPRGSATNGGGSLTSIYCDSLAFIQNGWVDYICPQIYWNIGYSIADYAILVPWWVNAVNGTDVKLYIGMADYRSAENQSAVWTGTAELERQMQYNKSYPQISGEVHFRYGSLIESPALYELYKSTASDVRRSTSVPVGDGLSPMERLRRSLTDLLKELVK